MMGVRRWVARRPAHEALEVLRAVTVLAGESLRMRHAVELAGDGMLAAEAEGARAAADRGEGRPADEESAAP